MDFGKLCLANLREDILGNRCQISRFIWKTKCQKDSKVDKKRFRDIGDIVKIPQVNQDWILPGSKYKTLLTRVVMADTPPFNDSGLITCNKGHVQRFCDEKCDRKKSHKKFDSASQKNAYDTWVKSLITKLP